jgi:hypothetical protein
MNLIITSRGRHDYAPTIESMPKRIREFVTVMVPKVEYKAYKASDLYKGTTIECWPSYVDCIPKKRRYLYENVDGAYLVLDDDLKIHLWSKKKSAYVAAVDHHEGMFKALEMTFNLFDKHTAVGASNTFMMPIKIRETGKLIHESAVPFCFAGFAKKRPKLEYQTFFFTDIAMPMQLLSKGLSVATNAAIGYGMRNNKKLQSTGTSVYRNDEIIKYSALALARQMPGYVFGLKHTGNNGGGWSLQKTFVRPNEERTKKWVKEFLQENGLIKAPKNVELDLKTPMAELFANYKYSWSRVRAK